MGDVLILCQIKIILLGTLLLGGDKKCFGLY